MPDGWQRADGTPAEGGAATLLLLRQKFHRPGATLPVLSHDQPDDFAGGLGDIQAPSADHIDRQSDLLRLSDIAFGWLFSLQRMRVCDRHCARWDHANIVSTSSVRGVRRPRHQRVVTVRLPDNERSGLHIIEKLGGPSVSHLLQKAEETRIEKRERQDEDVHERNVLPPARAVFPNLFLTCRFSARSRCCGHWERRERTLPRCRTKPNRRLPVRTDGRACRLRTSRSCCRGPRCLRRLH